MSRVLKVISLSLACGVVAAGLAVTTASPPAQASASIRGCAEVDDSAYSDTSLTIATWNITGPVPTKDTANWKWQNRVSGLVDFISRCGADVYLLQEASVARNPKIVPISGSVPWPDTISAFEQLLTAVNNRFSDMGLGSQFRYAMVDQRRGNCGVNYQNRLRKDNGERFDPKCFPTPGQVKKPGGKNIEDHADGNRIIYNIRTVSGPDTVADGKDSVSAGYGWKPITGGGKTTTAAWAKLRLIGGPEFFVVNTHITNTASISGKRAQVKSVKYLIKWKNPERLPTILGGDFNATRYQYKSPAKRAQNAVMKLYEIWGQDFNGSCDVPRSNRDFRRVPYTSEARTTSWFETTTNLDNLNSCTTKSYKSVGTAIDYLFTSKNIRPQSAEVVVNPATGSNDAGHYHREYSGYPRSRPNPSDHNMVVANLELRYYGPNYPAW